MKSKYLARLLGITEQNRSILKTGKAKAIRFSTLNAICRHLECQPADILEYKKESCLFANIYFPDINKS